MDAEPRAHGDAPPRVPRVMMQPMRRPALVLALAALRLGAQEVTVPPLMEFSGRAALVVVAHCERPDRGYLFRVLSTLKGDAGGRQLLLKIREANLAHAPDEPDAEIVPGRDYLLYLRPPAAAERRRYEGETAPVFFLFEKTRGAVALEGVEGAALRGAAEKLAALAREPLESREASVRARFLALAGKLPRLELAEGFELIELARVIDRFAMGTPEMAQPLLALSGSAPPPLAAALLRVLTQIAGDFGLGEFDRDRLFDLALRHSLAPEPFLRRQAVATLRVLPGAGPAERLERMGREDADEAIRLAAQSALIDRKQGKIRPPAAR